MAKRIKMFIGPSLEDIEQKVNAFFLTIIPSTKILGVALTKDGVYLYLVVFYDI